jgi:hypothetical protein
MSVWAVIVAIEDYPNVVGGLAQKLPDTNRAAALFRDWVIEVKNAPASNVISCAGAGLPWRTKGTTRQEIVDAFNWLVINARDQADEVYVLFSGHGIGFSDDLVDVLIGSEFADPATSGPACLRFSEVRERLRVALGPGKHFYFVDACRNKMTKDDIDPTTSIGSVWGRSKLGNATSYVLFSTAPGDVARVDSGFNSAVLRGLQGNGRAKTWIGGKMHVTFNYLSSYVQQMLKKDDLEPEKKGPLAADDRIIHLDPTPMSKCDVEIVDAGPQDQFTLNIADVRGLSLAPVSFVGPQTVFPLPPEDYLFRLTTAAGLEVLQVDPPPQDTGVDLYENRTVRFQTGLPVRHISAPPHFPAPAAPPLFPDPLVASKGSIVVKGFPKASVSFQEIATGQSETILLDHGVTTRTLEPGSYKARLQDGNFKLDSLRFEVLPGESVNVDFAPKVSQGAQLSLSKILPIDGSLINFSETLHSVPDWNLSLWLAVLGGSRIVAATDTFSKLQNIQLQDVGNATPNKSLLYVLAGELGTDKVPFCDVGKNPSRKPMSAVPDVPGLFQTSLAFEAGPLLVTYALDEKTTTTVLTYGLPNRATLLTFAHEEQYGRQIQQFVLPIHTLTNLLSEQELRYLRDPANPPLPLIRYMSTAQRLFARQAPIKGNTHEVNDRYWWDLLRGKWLNPFMALIACYELIRRGSADEDRHAMQEVLKNMRTYFPGLPDTEVIAMLLEENYHPPSAAPLVMDGVLAVSGRDVLPLPEDRLDFDSVWTCWRNAVEMRAR